MRILFKNKILVLALVVGSLLRFYQLDSLPALNADEAAIGYNAFSLLATGKDEHGNPWPIHFQSFNDYKPGLTVYLVMPFVKLFGLSILSVRFLPALMGILNILAIHFLVISIWKDKKLLASISALLLAITPWHIHFSRGAWEVNVATLFITLGIAYFVKATDDPKWFAFSTLMFVLSLYTYHAARIIVPLVGVGLLILYKEKIFNKSRFRLTWGAFLLGAVLLIPLMVDFVGPAGTARAGGVSIFSDRGPIDRINEKRGEHYNISGLATKMLHNKPVEYLFSFSENYFEHFWGEFLFLSGDDIQRNKVPEFGLLYLLQAPLLVLALFFIAKDYRNWSIILLWLALAPIPASITFQSPHALRAQSMVIPLTILSAYGLVKLHRLIKSKIFYGLVILVLVWDFSRYLHQYYSHMAKTYSFSSQYAVEEMIAYVESRKKEFTEIYITDKYDQPYILYLFYTKYDPSKFQKGHSLSGKDKFGFSTVRSFDKLKFDKIDWNTLRDKRHILVVGSDDEIRKEESNVVRTIYFPNGKIAFEAVEL